MSPRGAEDRGRSILPVIFAGVPALVAAALSGEIWGVGAALAGMVAGAAVIVRHAEWAEGGRRQAAAETADLRRAELQSEIRAERLDAVRRVSGGIAHDFNNLLTVIVGNLETLRPGLDGPARARLDMAVEASLRGSARIRQLLAFAQRQPLSARRIDPDAAIREVAGLLRRTLDEAIRLELVLHSGGWIISVDPGQLEAAVINLAINARDAMPAGGILTIETAMVPAEGGGAPIDRIRLTVRDTGTGIAPDLLVRVIEPFFTTKGPQQASGLGLSTVQGFAVQSGGSFQIDSTPGQGTRVDLYLPRSAGALELVEDAPMSDAGSENKTILVVEDDVIVRFTVAQMLADLGYEVVEAGNGREALELIEQGLKPDLLFTDVMMPGAVTVRALTAGAQAILPSLRILYTSGYTEDVIVRDGILDEGIHLLSKPYRPDDLARKIASVFA